MSFFRADNISDIRFDQKREVYVYFRAKPELDRNCAYQLNTKLTLQEVII